MEREVDPVSPALQVFQVRKVQGTNLGKIYAMKVLRKVSHLFGQQILARWLPSSMHYSRLPEDSSERDGGDGPCLGHWLVYCQLWLCRFAVIPNRGQYCLYIFESRLNRGATGIQWVEARAAAQHPTMYKTAPTAKDYLPEMSLVPKQRGTSRG